MALILTEAGKQVGLAPANEVIILSVSYSPGIDVSILVRVWYRRYNVWFVAYKFNEIDFVR